METNSIIPYSLWFSYNLASQVIQTLEGSDKIYERGVGVNKITISSALPANYTMNIVYTQGTEKTTSIPLFKSSSSGLAWEVQWNCATGLKFVLLV